MGIIAQEVGITGRKGTAKARVFPENTNALRTENAERIARLAGHIDAKQKHQMPS
jgi:hypothetical protein